MLPEVKSTCLELIKWGCSTETTTVEEILIKFSTWVQSSLPVEWKLSMLLAMSICSSQWAPFPFNRNHSRQLTTNLKSIKTIWKRKQAQNWHSTSGAANPLGEMMKVALAADCCHEFGVPFIMNLSLPPSVHRICNLLWTTFKLLKMISK